MTMSKWIGSICFVFAALALAGTGSAEPRRLYPDVTGLFERVAVNPGANMFAAPGGSPSGQPDAFSVFYVFDSRRSGGQTWLHVGPNAEGTATGWLRENDSTELRHLLVLGPQTRQNRERALFFETLEDLQALASSRTRVETYRRFVQDAASGSAAPGIVGIQPANQPAMSDAFSFMPIRAVESEGAAFISGLGNNRFFETLSIPLPPAEAGNRSFKTGVVFVIDTTTSMGPYIEGARAMMRDVRETLEAETEPGSISFGIVAFRDNVDVRPALEYTTKVAFPLASRFDAQAFDRAISNLREATVSSPDFQEDAVAGLNTALELPGWDSFEKRIIILISDAPTRGGSPDDRSSTGLTLDSIKLEAENKRTTIATVHLATPAGAQMHRQAQRQYQTISRWQNGNPAVISIPNGNFDDYAQDMERLVKGVAEILSDDEMPDCDTPRGLSDVDKVLCEIEDRTHAVRMEWLGRQAGVPAPAISSAWVSDVSLDSTRASTQTMAFKPYLLLTRNQLNDLILVLEDLVEVAEANIDSNREEVLRIFQGALSRGAVNQDLLTSAAAGGNAPLISDYSKMSDFLPAFISELPITSPFMRLEVGTWINPSEQAAHMIEVEIKLIEYRDYLRDDARWIALSEGAEYGDLVYPIPWDRIP